MNAPGEVRYARSRDGIDIAYMVIGDGPVDVVNVSGFISHLDLMWDIPAFGLWAKRLSEHCRLLLFDKRGTGLSDRSLGHGSLENRMDDIRTVMDAAGFDQAAMCCISEGGPLALLFAATYPERVTRLVLIGTYARGLWAPDYPAGIDSGIGEAFCDFVETRWGTGKVVRQFLSDAPVESDEAQSVAGRYERNSCTPQMAASILRHNIDIDVRSLLSAISMPTLVMHNSGDPIVSAASGRYLAEHIAGAKYLEFERDGHVAWDAAGTLERLAPVIEFLTGDEADAPPPRPERALATILFTDIVGSTERAADLGDAAWRALLDRHDTAAAEHVTKFDGRVVKTTGDGVMASFEGPSRAVLCARSLHEATASMGLPIRAGVHTGEVEVRGADLGGIGVHIAARVAALAGAGEVLATRTVRELTAGSGLEFAERGRHELKGVPDEWELYALVD